MKPVREVYIALVHWPVYDAKRKIVATNVTNFDIHDIARAARTYGVKKYFIVHRIQEQLMFVSRVLDHWRVGEGAKHNIMRKSALDMIELKETVEQVVQSFETPPLVLATSARLTGIALQKTFVETKKMIFETEGPPLLILFGTGFGLHEDVLNLCDIALEPIRGSSQDDYRHLSVRSAVSICLDRLLGA